MSRDLFDTPSSTYNAAAYAQLAADGERARSSMALAALLSERDCPPLGWSFAIVMHGLSEGSERAFEMADYPIGKLLRKGRGEGLKQASVEKRSQRARAEWDAWQETHGLGWINAVSGDWDKETERRGKTTYYPAGLVRAIGRTLELADEAMRNGEVDFKIAVETGAQIVVADDAARERRKWGKDKTSNDSPQRRIKTIATHSQKTMAMVSTRALAHARTWAAKSPTPVDVEAERQRAVFATQRDIMLAAAGLTQPHHRTPEDDAKLVDAAAVMLAEVRRRGLEERVDAVVHSISPPTGQGSAEASDGDAAPMLPDTPEPDAPIGGQDCLPIPQTADSIDNLSDGPNHPDIEDAVEEAECAVSALALVAGPRFGVEVLDDRAATWEESHVDWKVFDAVSLIANLHHYARRNRRDHHSVVLRFQSDTFGYHGCMHHEDMPDAVRELLEPVATLTLRTSENSNHSVTALCDERGDPLPDAEMREVRERLARRFAADGLNEGSRGALRLPGMLNCKPKHRRDDGSYPRVRVVSVNPGLRVTVAALERAGLLAPRLPKVVEACRPRRGRREQTWPDWDTALGQAGCYPAGDKYAGEPNQTLAVFKYAKWSIERGFSETEVECHVSGLSAWLGTRREAWIKKLVRRASARARTEVVQ